MSELIEPRTAAELADVMRQCAAGGIRVQPAGAMTWLRPVRADAVTISTRRLTGLDAYEPEDLTVTAHAGTSLEQLQQEVGLKRQWLALDPPALAGATIGAVAATASSGPMRVLYGTPRDHVLGLDLVTGDGRLLHFGGRVVKNVAGYDMVRPVVGSYGTLGIITSISVRLRPLPLADETLLFPVPPAALAGAGVIVERAWPVAACELLSPALAAAIIGDPVIGDPVIGDAVIGDAVIDDPVMAAGWVLLIRLHGHPAEVREGRARLTTALGASPVTATGEVWTRLSAVEAAEPTCCRFTGPVSALGVLLEAANTLAANTLAERTLAGPPRVAAHSASGIVRVWGALHGTGSHKVWNDAVAAVASVGGTSTCRVEGLATPPRADAVIRIEQGIRRLFDPAGILPPFAA